MSRGIYDYDTSLDDYANLDANDDLYPDAAIHLAPPPTEQEKKWIAREREHLAAMRRGPFYVDTSSATKRNLSEYNAFEDFNTFSNNKRPKANGGLPNLKNVPIVKELLPADLLSDGEDDDDDDGETERINTKKSLAFLKKSRIDRLARFDEGADADDAADKDDDENENEEDEEDDGVEEPQDDDFDEDDDDLGNDYNAEKYFDDGDGADDEGDGGDNEEAWADEDIRYAKTSSTSDYALERQKAVVIRKRFKYHEARRHPERVWAPGAITMAASDEVLRLAAEKLSESKEG